MSLNESELKSGLKFIVGTWEIDFLVNAFSNNLEHIPASEFKSKDGKDLSQISWEFFEDHNVKAKNGATGLEESGTWEQTNSTTFTYTCGKFFGDLDEKLKESIQKLEKDMEGGLVFSFGFLVVRLKKTAEGVITKEPDIGEIEPSPEDLKMKAIVGRWKVFKRRTCVGDDIGVFTKEEAEAGWKKDLEKGDIDEQELKEKLESFNWITEFTDDYKVITYTPIPSDCSKEELDEAIASGEVKIKDGMIADEDVKEWKAVKGDYWYNTEEVCEICGEVKSPWIKITPDADGHIDLVMFVIEKI